MLDGVWHCWFCACSKDVLDSDQFVGQPVLCNGNIFRGFDRAHAYAFFVLSEVEALFS